MRQQGILTQRQLCPHPPDDRVQNPKRPAQTLCGKCGTVVQGLDAELLIDAAEKIRRDGGRR